LLKVFEHRDREEMLDNLGAILYFYTFARSDDEK